MAWQGNGSRGCGQGSPRNPTSVPVREYPIRLAERVFVVKGRMHRQKGPAGELRQFAFGDAAVEAWTAHGAGDPGEPWLSFDRARRQVQAGHQDEAAAIWRQIATTDGLESRHTLQAWHFLRQTGQSPPPDRATLVLGTAVEMPVPQGHDLLIAYRDGSARYLNYSGKVLVWEARSDPEVGAAITAWLSAGQVISDAIGVWDRPSLPPVPPGHARLLMLTPGGHRFGQAPAAALSSDPTAGPFIAAATRVLQLITSRA